MSNFGISTAPLLGELGGFAALGGAFLLKRDSLLAGESTRARIAEE